MITVKKKSSGGGLVDLAASDITSGQVYQIIYDGVFWELFSLSFPPSSTFFQVANNSVLRCVASTMRTNLGLGSAALLAASAVLQTANNLSDIPSKPTAQVNLGVRIVLTANTTYHVATTGNDSTGTGSSGAPWLKRSVRMPLPITLTTQSSYDLGKQWILRPSSSRLATEPIPQALLSAAHLLGQALSRQNRSRKRRLIGRKRHANNCKFDQCVRFYGVGSRRAFINAILMNVVNVAGFKVTGTGSAAQFALSAGLVMERRSTSSMARWILPAISLKCPHVQFAR